MQEIKAIETSYGGFVFRSRLEARWAVLFSELGMRWEYEKEGFDLGDAGWYLPDFWLPDYKCWLEVKGEQPTHVDERKIIAFRKHSENPLFVSIGQIGNHEWDSGGESEIRKWNLRYSGLVYRLFDAAVFDDWAVIKCPFCLSGPVQLVEFLLNSHRGFGFTIRGSKCNHQWQIAIEKNDEGVYTRIFGHERSLADSFDLVLMMVGSIEHYQSVIGAARSARFEHGVSGALHREQTRR